MRADPVVITTLLFLLKATGVLLVTIAAAALLRRASAGTRHTVWLTALVLILALPLLATALPDWRVLPIVPAGPTPLAGPAALPELSASMWEEHAANGVEAAVASQPHVSNTAAPGALAGASRYGRGVSSFREVVPWGDPAAVLLAVWGFGTLIVLGRLARSALRLRRILAEADLLRDSDWTTPLWEAADRLNLAEAPRLLISDRVTMPFACGLLRPTIVVPATAAGWSEARRRAVLSHELAHIRRRDLLGHTLGRLACGIYWMHPLVWAAARRLRTESERACDDLVLSTGTPASEYADHLLQILVGVRRNDAPAVALPMGRRREVEGRLLAILDPALRRHGSTLAHGAILTGLSLAAAALIAMAPVDATDSRSTAWSEADATDPVTAGGPQPAHDPDTVPGVGGVREKTEAWSESSGRSVFDSGGVLDSGKPPQGAPVPEPAPEPHSQPHQVQLPHTPVQVVEELAEEFGIHLAGAVEGFVTTAVSGIFGVGGAQEKNIPLLVRLLDTDESAEVRRTAAWGLYDTGDARANTALIRALRQDGAVEVREMAAWALQKVRTPAAIEALVFATRDVSPEIRARAAWSLGHSKHQEERVLAALAARLSDPDAEVRLMAAWAIGTLEPGSAPAALYRESLRDADAEVRLMAGWALGQIRDPLAQAALAQALPTETNAKAVEAITRALLRLGPIDSRALDALLASPDPEIRAHAIRIAAGVGAEPWPWPWPWPEPRPLP